MSRVPVLLAIIIEVPLNTNYLRLSLKSFSSMEARSGVLLILE